MSFHNIHQIINQNPPKDKFKHSLLKITNVIIMPILKYYNALNQLEFQINPAFLMIHNHYLKINKNWPL
jgi:hypothetical protein